MANHSKNCFALLAFLLFAFVTPVLGQKAGMKKETPYYMRPQFAWTQDAWTADEKPFQSARVALVMAQQQHKDMLALAKQYGAAAKKRPNDALAVFKWGCAAWLAYNYGLNTAANAALFEAYNALERTPSPHSYQYDRLRYLIDACNSRRGVKELGERLLKRNPNDFYVIYYQIGITYGSLSDTDNQRALELSKLLIQKYPKNPTGYERAGTTYEGLWWCNKKKSDAQTAIDYFRKGKTFLPSNDPNQAKYDEEIDLIDHEMKQAH